MGMMTFTAPQPAGSLDLDEGLYTLRFTGYDYPLMEGCGYNEPNDPEICKYERRTKFHFAVVEDGVQTADRVSEYVTLQVKYEGINDPSGWKTMLGERSKFGKFLKALNGGQAIAPGEQVDVDSFVGKDIQATLEKNEKGYMKVTSPVAIRPKRKAAAAAAPAASSANPFADED